jgi:hypothetical protein
MWGWPNNKGNKRVRECATYRRRKKRFLSFNGRSSLWRSPEMTGGCRNMVVVAGNSVSNGG